jgi:predicted Kef-type K+ transport protein
MGFFLAGQLLRSQHPAIERSNSLIILLDDLTVKLFLSIGLRTGWEKLTYELKSA